jgi:hypothetical protein
MTRRNKARVVKGAEGYCLREMPGFSANRSSYPGRKMVSVIFVHQHREALSL